MERELCIRLVRRICTAVLVVLLLLFFNAHVLATETAENPEAVLNRTEETLQADLEAADFAAVAVQLEAVARSEGRSMADRMLYDGLSTVSALSGGTQGETLNSSSLNLIAVPEAGPEMSLGGWLPYLAAVLLAVVFFGTVLARRHRRLSGRIVYKPMRPAVHSPYLQYTVQRTYH